MLKPPRVARACGERCILRLLLEKGLYLRGTYLASLARAFAVLRSPVPQFDRYQMYFATDRAFERGFTLQFSATVGFSTSIDCSFLLLFSVIHQSSRESMVYE